VLTAEGGDGYIEMTENLQVTVDYVLNWNKSY